MTDIADLHAEWLELYVRRTRNFAPLADWLRAGGALDEPLRQLLADIVAGDLKPLIRKPTRTTTALPGLLRKEVAFWKAQLRGHAHNEDNPSVPWGKLADLLTLAGVLSD